MLKAIFLSNLKEFTQPSFLSYFVASIIADFLVTASLLYFRYVAYHLFSFIAFCFYFFNQLKNNNLHSRTLNLALVFKISKNMLLIVLFQKIGNITRSCTAWLALIKPFHNLSSSTYTLIRYTDKKTSIHQHLFTLPVFQCVL